MDRRSFEWSMFVAVLLVSLSLILPAASSAQITPMPKNAPKTAAEAIAQVVLANRILANEGIRDALGHVSLRNPENPKTFFQSRSLAPFQVTKEDILEIDLDGNVVHTADHEGVKSALDA
jgi:hypothetical protein